MNGVWDAFRQSFAHFKVWRYMKIEWSALYLGSFATGKRHSHWMRDRMNVSLPLCGGNLKKKIAPAPVGNGTPVFQSRSHFVY
jgi:hypothetical protein